MSSRIGNFNQEDIDLTKLVMALHEDSFIGGSFVVHLWEANDIDIVVSTSAADHKWLGTNLYRQDFESNPAYDGIGELHSTYRKGNVNVLVVRDDFVDCYREAAQTMKTRPEQYQDRKQRVYFHQMLKNIVRRRLGQEEYDLSALEVD